MGVVVGDLVLLIVLISAAGLAFYSVSAKRDRQVLAARHLSEEQERKRAERDSMLYKENVRLVCMNCNTRFNGPLTEDGCPQCHVSSLTVTEDEYSANAENG